MIRYPILETKSRVTPARELQELHRLIEAEKPGWLKRATAQTKACRQAKAYLPGQDIWGEVKQLYMKLQRGKCAYCEVKIGDQSFDRIEFDVEHFRPKSKVRQWPTAKLAAELKLNYDFATGDAADSGYYLLPYHPLNYLASCKKCNTNCKSDYFPIARKSRSLDSDDLAALKREKPFLPYPLGFLDDDPEELITFQGVTPVPVASSGIKYRRARITIDFFRLAIREDLLFERAYILRNLFIALDYRQSAPATERKELDIDIETTCSPWFPHSSCARAFRRTFDTDRQLARQYFNESKQYLGAAPADRTTAARS